MIVKCLTCELYFEDALRLTYCPHDTFAANDGKNNFEHHPGSYLSQEPPQCAPRESSPHDWMPVDRVAEKRPYLKPVLFSSAIAVALLLIAASPVFAGVSIGMWLSGQPLTWWQWVPIGVTGLSLFVVAFAIATFVREIFW